MMENKQQINRLQETQKALQQEEQEQRLLEKSTLNKMNELLKENLVYADRVDQNNKLHNQDVRQEVNKLKDIVQENIKPQNNIRPENDNKVVLENAIRETEQMVKISQEAMRLRQVYSKQQDDVAQVSKNDTTPNTKTGSFVEQFAAMSQAIEQEEKTNFKTIRVSEEVSIKNQMTQQKPTEQDQVELNISQVKKPQEEKKLDLSMDMNYSNTNQQSKGKEIIEEKRKEAIEQKQQQIFLSPENEELKENQHKINKLKAKFRKSSMHF